MESSLQNIVRLCEHYNTDPTEDKGLKRVQEVVRRLHLTFLAHPRFGRGGGVYAIVTTLLAVLVVIEMVIGVKDKQIKLQYLLKELWGDRVVPL